MKNLLFGKTLAELSQVVKDLSMPSFSAQQIAGWLYKKNVSSIDNMTNISAKARMMLKESFIVGVSKPLAEMVSEDGAKKYVFPANLANLEGKAEIVESAFIPEKDRATLCISSQAGCRMGCVFCMTGRYGMKRNLTSAEILNQFRSLPEHNILTNIVFMGMGEPFDNAEDVFKSLEILTSDYGYGWAPKRITVSTIGVIPAISRFMDNTRFNLAVSLHHPDSTKRRKLVPAENKYPMKNIIELLKKYDLNRQRRISFEYVMLAGVNDSLQEAKDTARLLSGLRCRMNLIRYHAIPGCPFAPSSEQNIQQFADTLNRKGIITTIRKSRGVDIDAACGMLFPKFQSLNP